MQPNALHGNWATLLASGGSGTPLTSGAQQVGQTAELFADQLTAQLAPAEQHLQQGDEGSGVASPPAASPAMSGSLVQLIGEAARLEPLKSELKEHAVTESGVSPMFFAAPGLVGAESLAATGQVTMPPESEAPAEVLVVADSIAAPTELMDMPHEAAAIGNTPGDAHNLAGAAATPAPTPSDIKAAQVSQGTAPAPTLPPVWPQAQADATATGRQTAEEIQVSDEAEAQKALDLPSELHSGPAANGSDPASEFWQEPESARQRAALDKGGSQVTAGAIAAAAKPEPAGQFDSKALASSGLQAAMPAAGELAKPTPPKPEPANNLRHLILHNAEAGQQEPLHGNLKNALAEPDLAHLQTMLSVEPEQQDRIVSPHFKQSPPLPELESGLLAQSPVSPAEGDVAVPRPALPDLMTREAGVLLRVSKQGDRTELWSVVSPRQIEGSAVPATQLTQVLSLGQVDLINVRTAKEQVPGVGMPALTHVSAKSELDRVTPKAVLPINTPKSAPEVPAQTLDAKAQNLLTHKQPATLPSPAESWTVLAGQIRSGEGEWDGQTGADWLASAASSTSSLPLRLMPFVQNGTQLTAAGLDYAALARQLLDSAEMARLAGNGDYEARLELNPPQLGRMLAQIAVRGEQVAVQLSVASSLPRRQLEEGMNGLKRSLEQAGLEVTDLRVVNLDPERESGQQERRQQGFSPGQHLLRRAVVAGSDQRPFLSELRQSQQEESLLAVRKRLGLGVA